MKIPNKIKILGYDYEVVFRESRLKEDGSEHSGTHCARVQKIWIDKEQTQQQQESTFIHEILEAISYSLELNMPHNVISSLESALYQTLKDNNLLK